MADIGLVVPVMKNFEGFTRLMASVDTRVLPIVIPNYDENKGVSWGWNEGIRRAAEAGCEVVVISNDDVVYEPNCLDHLACSIKMDKFDLVSAVNLRDYKEPGEGYSSEVDYSCFAVNPQTFFDKFGTFDEKFFPAYFEDNDMYRRIELAYGHQRKNLKARMFHKGSQTQNFNGEQVVTSTMFEANRDYYRGKWGGVPGEETWDAPFNGLTGKTYRDW